MALFLRERAPKNISEMVKLAEQYLEAHEMSLQELQKPMKKLPNGHHQKSKDPSKTKQKETDKNEGRCYVLLLLLLLSTRLQTPTDRAKCHKPEGTSREGNPKEEKINKNEGKKDKNTI